MFTTLEDKDGNVLARITKISEGESGWLSAELADVNFSAELEKLFDEYIEFAEGFTLGLLDEVMCSLDGYGMRVRDESGKVTNLSRVYREEDDVLCFKWDKATYLSRIAATGETGERTLLMMYLDSEEDKESFAQKIASIVGGEYGKVSIATSWATIYIDINNDFKKKRDGCVLKDFKGYRFIIKFAIKCVPEPNKWIPEEYCREGAIKLLGQLINDDYAVMLT